jgi:transcriptional regulator with XRE-family HTH domain
MTELGERIQLLRKKDGLSQSQLADAINISLTQLQRYENKNVQPPADVLKRLADNFNTSIDYLVSGDTEQKAMKSIRDTELLIQFQSVEKMNDKDKGIIKDLIDAFIKRNKLQELIAS